MADERIDYSQKVEPENVSQKNVPQRETRSQPVKEAAPDYYRRNLEKEGASSWSGAWAGGRGR